MVDQTQKVKNATCDWFCADWSHMVSILIMTKLAKG